MFHDPMMRANTVGRLWVVSDVDPAIEPPLGVAFSGEPEEISISLIEHILLEVMKVRVAVPRSCEFGVYSLRLGSKQS